MTRPGTFVPQYPRTVIQAPAYSQSTRHCHQCCISIRENCSH